MAETVAMYKTERTSARPPQTDRRPRNFPLSRFKGATPTNLAISLRFRLPSSGTLLNRVWHNTGPTPLALCKISSFARQRGLFWIMSSKSLPKLSRHFCSHSIWARISFFVHWGAVYRRSFSAVNISTICRRRVRSASSSCVSSVLRGLISDGWRRQRRR